MNYEIKQDIIPGLPKDAYRKGMGAYEGVVAHSTAVPEVGDERQVQFFKSNWKSHGAFVHFFVDWDSITQTADTTYKAWGAGPKGNQRYVHVELCETKDEDKFKESYKRYVWVLAKILRDKYLGVTSGGTLVSHAWVTQNLGGTTHMDPIDYLQSHGISWTQLVADVQAEYNPPVVKTEPIQQEPADTTLYRLRSGAFKNAADLAKAIEFLKTKGWTVYEKADSTELNPSYRFITGTFVGKAAADKAADELNKKYGWVIYIDLA